MAQPLIDDSQIDVTALGNNATMQALLGGGGGASFEGAVVNGTGASAQTLISGSLVVDFGELQYETDSEFWSSGQPSRLTIPSGFGAGYARVVAQCQYPNTTNTSHRMLFYKNGGLYSAGVPRVARPQQGFISQFQVVSYWEPVVANDYFELVINSSGIVGTPSLGKNDDLWFGIEWRE